VKPTDKAVVATLRDLLDVTRREIEVFEPRDNIDIQSFIWIVGGYDEAEAGRAVTT
jgi:hypothetical protein